MKFSQKKHTAIVFQYIATVYVVPRSHKLEMAIYLRLLQTGCEPFDYIVLPMFFLIKDDWFLQ